MFVREAKIMARLRHPNIVGAIDFAEENESYVLVLEYVHGFDLSKWHRFVRSTRGPFSVDLALYIVLTLLDALSYAHEARGTDGTPLGVIHRDVTPSNVLIDVTGQVKLADFGIASAVGDVTNDGSSDSVRVRGKFPYLAPELFGGAKPSPSSDTYSVAVILHELLVGRNEFHTGDVASTIKKVLDHVPTPIDAVRDDCPEGLHEVLSRALSKNEFERYPTAQDLATALRAVFDVPVHEARARLEEAAARDFRDPAFSQSVGAAPLGELEAAWLGTGEEDDEPLTTTKARIELGEDGQPVLITSSGPTALEKWVPDGGAPAASRRKLASTPPPGSLEAPHPLETTPQLERIRRRRRPRSLTLFLGAAAAALGAVAIYAIVAPEPEPQVVVVRGGDVSAAPAAEESGATDDSAASATPDPLTAAFAQRQPAIGRCFEAHAESVDGRPEIALRLRVELDGSISRAELIPEPLGATALGGCLLDLARETELPPPATPLTIRVPITATRVGS
jgi:serine/threonine-protein kinase